MAKDKRKSRKSVKLPEGLEKRLSVYALAAGAAGVGVLGFSPTAKADIITDTTPISINSYSHSVETLSIAGEPRIAFADLLGHFTQPLCIGGYYLFGVCITPATAYVIAGEVGARGGPSGTGLLVGPLNAGATVGPGGAFTEGTVTLATNYHVTFAALGVPFTYAGTVGGPWADKFGYLGFKFMSHSQSYFGWAHLRVTANSQDGETAYISEFAYESCAGQAIQAGQTSDGATCSQPTNTPEPGTLSLLALGAVGLFGLRRKKLAAGN